MQIAEQHLYLIVQFEVGEESPSYHVAFVDEAELENAEWNGTTRLSPVWGVELEDPAKSVKEQNPLTEDSHVCFLGPVDPQVALEALQTPLLSRLRNGDAWLTLGSFNIVLLLRERDDLQLIRDFCVAHECSAEFWPVLGESDIADFRCDGIEYFRPEHLKAEDDENRAASLSHIQIKDVVSSVDASIKQAFLEFYSLRQISFHRSHSSLRKMDEDVQTISTFVPSFEKLIFDSDLNQPGKPDPNETSSQNEFKDRERRTVDALRYRDQVIGINAALSRHISQALSGVSPIIQTECHFWPHSLLGIGIANLALRNLAASVIGSVNLSNFNHNYHVRLEQPFNFVINSINPDSTVASLQLSDFEKLSLAKEPPKKDEEESYHIPKPITYYSGREGFRYGTFSVSAPLLSVGGCNSKQWNLGTISHELSHRVVSPKFRSLLKGVEILVAKNANVGLKELCRLSEETVKGSAQVLLANSLMLAEAHRVGKERFERQQEDVIAFIANSIAHNRHEIEEKLVHLFDYYHFYAMDPEEYVANIWQSWAIQPSIADKFDKYIERTIVALSVKHLKSENWAELSYQDFVLAAQDHKFWHETIYQDRLQAELDNNKDGIGKILRRNWPVISLFCLLLKSSHLAKLAEIEKRDTTNSKKLQVLDVSGLKFPKHSNPLRFVRDMTNDKVPNSAKSAWLLSALAFRYYPENGGD